MKSIDTFDFQNRKVLVRVDFNVPLNEKFEITDTTRIDAAIPTIKKIVNGGGAAILMSHLGRPKEGPEDKFSLKHVIPYLSKELDQEVKFANDCIGESARTHAAGLKPGEVLLLENLRFYKEETKGDEAFSKKLADLGDVYMNDAFGTAHRAHASTAVMAEFFPEDKMFGYIMENEVKSIDKVLHESQRPFTAILGGAKVSGKIEIINNLLDKVDNLIVGGGMMFTFIHAQGGHVGKSLIEDELLELALHTIEGAAERGVNLYLPTDTIIADKFENDANSEVSSVDDIPDDWMGLDIGPESVKKFTEVIKNSKTILWNGPMGVFEMDNFAAGTKAIALAVADATSAGAFSLIGGGDSVAAINKYDLKDKVSYVSTGGGAMLEYIEGKELPGVKAIKE
ncbi:MAG TPA: phosphoglycerate kinase [Bacteroidales bacterium]|nr:phosphoglycerate kinase [Bacteroidales bacterium]HRX96213.1 phosphoglycerate kinase [Bacteroidales bacterium]